VIIKGKSVGGGKRLATHLMRTDTNERAEVRELRGVAAEDLRGALLEMEAVASGSRTTKPFYHASINTRADERLTAEQRTHAIDRLEEKLGLTGQPRVVVVHEKEGREHCHIVWSRIDLDRMRAISDSYNYRKHEEVARDLEREFGHERVQGAHAERDGKDRPDRTPSHEEMLQADRGAVSPDEAKALVTELWRRTDSGQSFRAALEERDWILARGDRRDFVVIDPEGGTHSLARRVEGAKAKDIRARMVDIDSELLPSVAEARAVQRERRSPTPEPSSDEHATSASKKSRETDERDALGPQEWTDRGGMVAQQESPSKNFALRGSKRRRQRLSNRAKPTLWKNIQRERLGGGPPKRQPHAQTIQITAKSQAGEGGRDEPLTGGAARQRNDEQPETSRPAEGDEDHVVSIDGELASCVNSTVPPSISRGVPY
jgi:Relaxase/Mobilisation nuclease domain